MTWLVKTLSKQGSNIIINVWTHYISNNKAQKFTDFNMKKDHQYLKETRISNES